VAVQSESSSERSLLFIKYEAGVEHDDAGRRGGVGYEADVYEDILVPSGLLSDIFLGAIRIEKTRQTWLVLRYLENGRRISRMSALPAAAAWVARLHGLFDAASARPSWLLEYDASYLTSWATRASSIFDRLGVEDPALSRLLERFLEEGVRSLLAVQTLIHGEYVPRNILCAGEKIVPVDWESLAVGAGEIDLSMLTDGWPRRSAVECVARYASTRWPNGVPGDFAGRLFWARVYTSLRWLDEVRPGEWPGASRLAKLRRLAQAG
jgi:aminoglycoside phosphotransferase (APT) family kinase protein